MVPISDKEEQCATQPFTSYTEVSYVLQWKSLQFLVPALHRLVYLYLVRSKKIQVLLQISCCNGPRIPAKIISFIPLFQMVEGFQKIISSGKTFCGQGRWQERELLQLAAVAIQPHLLRNLQKQKTLHPPRAYNVPDSMLIWSSNSHQF